ncbi:MAG: hypothetical protein BGO21_00240 [Dyadobacter sp. 50-39]|uniref:hypothetical protein n=1 Tax=Dyadobacter sp. 50-39 TaxID=1895756 RepID=UPI00095FD78A|nr:hypothetical protein [Dyadobacter sp. 50-39]OJV21705.1 MAG: hypothetical protein BGO21_00240 [Dyadobacter sp. 50-39]
MFTLNPWADYLTVLGPLIAVYYLFVGLKFYSRDLKARIISGRNSRRSRRPKMKRKEDHEDALEVEDPAVESVNPTSDASHSWKNEALFSQVEGLAAHLREVIAEAHEKHYEREELVLLLQMTLKEYPAIPGTPFQLAINNLIGSECAKYGSIHLDAQDKVMIWN